MLKAKIWIVRNKTFLFIAKKKQHFLITAKLFFLAAEVNLFMGEVNLLLITTVYWGWSVSMSYFWHPTFLNLVLDARGLTYKQQTRISYAKIGIRCRSWRDGVNSTFKKPLFSLQVNSPTSLLYFNCPIVFLFFSWKKQARVSYY